MDKLRSIVSKPREFFTPSSNDVSPDDVIADLVKELMHDSSVHYSNSSADKTRILKSNSETAAKALQFIYGGRPKSSNDQSLISEKINTAKANYLKNPHLKDKASASTQFNEAIKRRLAEHLSPRMQAVYFAQREKLDAGFREGKLTQHECDRDMAQYLNEGPTTGFTLDVEVQSALRFLIRDEKDVINGLFFLFNGLLHDAEKRILFNHYDDIRDEAAEARLHDSDKYQEKKTAFDRAFTTEARRQLASRLPDNSRKEYFKLENDLQEKLKTNVIQYDRYKELMLDFLCTHGIDNTVETLVGSLNEKQGDYYELWDYLCGYGKLLSHPEIGLQKLQEPAQGISKAAKIFRKAASQHINSTAANENGIEEKYALLVSKTKEQITLNLANDDRKKIGNNLVTLNEFLKNGIIDKRTHQIGIDQYISELLYKQKNDQNTGQSNIYEKFLAARDRDRDRDFEAYYLAIDGLDYSFEKGGETHNVLEALIMCWGGSFNIKQADETGFKLSPLRAHRHKYLHPSNPDYKEDGTPFLFYETFSIEARDLLYKKLPDPLKQKYIDRDQLLLGHCRSGAIAVQTYALGMLMFLKKELEDSKAGFLQ